jgi:hypothetical protein
VDISPSSRLFIKESEIIAKLYAGVEKLMSIEDAMTVKVATAQLEDFQLVDVPDEPPISSN